MRIRAAVTTALLCLALGPVPGGHAAPAAAPRTRAPLGDTAGFWSRLAGPDGTVDPVRAWRESVAATAARAHPFATVEASPSTTDDKTATFTDIGPAGDLDGDGGDDVVLLRQTFRVTPVWVLARVDVEARNGRTGAWLWDTRVLVPEPSCEHAGCGYFDSFGYAFATPVRGAAGVEIVMFGLVDDQQFVEDPVTHFPALVPDSSIMSTFDAITLDRHGNLAWGKHLEGRIREDGPLLRVQSLPVVYDASANLEPGADLDWLLDVTDGVVRPGTGTYSAVNRTVTVDDPDVDLSTWQPEILDGRTGALRAVGAKQQSGWAGRDLVVAGDLSGDGLDDVLLLPPLSFEPKPATITAYRSTDGATLWQRTTGPTNVSALAAGDVTGDKRSDLLLAEWTFDSTGPVPISLANGADGKTVWKHSGDSAAVVRGRRPLVVLMGVAHSGTKTYVTATAYDVRGSAAYSRKYRLTGATASHAAGADFVPDGDLDGDGAQDVLLLVVVRYVTHSGNTTTVTLSPVTVAAFSGATGKTLPAYDDQTYTLDGGLDGRGDDVETDGPRGMRVRDGRTGRTLLVVDLGRPITYILVALPKADRDRCRDVFVAAQIKGTSSVVYGVVSGATAKPLWQRVDGAKTSARITTSKRAYHCR